MAMTKKQKSILVGILVISLVAGLIYYVAVKVINKSKNSSENDLSGSESSGTSTTVQISSQFPLQKGSSGEKVKTLQRWINAQAQAMAGFVTVPNAPLTVDGVFGNKTEAAIKFIASYGWQAQNATSKEIYPVTEPFFYVNVVPMKILKTIMGFENKAFDITQLNIS